VAAEPSRRLARPSSGITTTATAVRAIPAAVAFAWWRLATSQADAAAM
jgi:hypothetical protein